MLLQVRLGLGLHPFGGAFRGMGAGAVLSVFNDTSNWIYLAAIVVLLLIGIVLIGLVIREYRLQKKK